MNTIVSKYFFAAVLSSATALFSLATLPAQAGLFDDDEARKAILDLRGKVDQQGRDFQQKQQELNTRTDQLEQTSKGLLQLNNQLEQLRSEIARLRGQVELQTNEISNLQKTQRDAVAAIDARVKPLEPTATQVDGKQILVTPAEKRRYDAALAMIRAGDFKNALSALNQFQIAYPDSGYQPSISYWQGACHYGLKDYKSAIASMQSVLAAQPDSPRVPDAVFTLGISQVESGDRRGGKRTLETVVERFPDSPVAAAARERIPTIRP